MTGSQAAHCRAGRVSPSVVQHAAGRSRAVDIPPTSWLGRSSHWTGRCRLDVPQTLVSWCTGLASPGSNDRVLSARSGWRREDSPLHSTFGGCPPRGASVACSPDRRLPRGAEMDHYELGVALAVAHLAELHRQADRRRLASRIPGRTARRHRDSPPGSPRVIGRHGHAAAGAGGGRAVAAAVAGGPGRGTEEGAMLVQHQHEPGVFDPDQCRTAPAGRACWTTTTASSTRRSASGKPIGMHTGRCGRRRPRCCWPPSPC
jgi:hypothetical protein